MPCRALLRRRRRSTVRGHGAAQRDARPTLGREALEHFRRKCWTLATGVEVGVPSRGRTLKCLSHFVEQVAGRQGAEQRSALPFGGARQGAARRAKEWPSPCQSCAQSREMLCSRAHDSGVPNGRQDVGAAVPGCAGHARRGREELCRSDARQVAARRAGTGAQPCQAVPDARAEQRRCSASGRAGQGAAGVPGRGHSRARLCQTRAEQRRCSASGRAGQGVAGVPGARAEQRRCSAVRARARGCCHEVSAGPDAFGGSSSRGHRQRRGEDVVHSLKVSLEDLYNGTSKKLSSSRNALCAKCKGKGSKSGVSGRCYGCQGTGVRTVTRQIGLGMIQQMQHACPDCRGSGEVISDKDKCPQCKGNKVTQEKKVLEVHVEKGMQHGEKIVFQGEADEAPDTVTGDIIFMLQQKEQSEVVVQKEDIQEPMTLVSEIKDQAELQSAEVELKEETEVAGGQPWTRRSGRLNETKHGG